MALELWVLKVLSALASASLAVLGCWLARGMEKSRGSGRLQEHILNIGNTFAAGILLAAGLTHMLPDATDALQDVSKFPLAPGIAGSAFCFLVILGEAHSVFARSTVVPPREDAGQNDMQSSFAGCHPVVTETGSSMAEFKSFLLFFALSFHSVMEGLGVGSSGESLLGPIVLAILAHKGLAAFALGSSLTKSEPTAKKTKKEAAAEGTAAEETAEETTEETTAGEEDETTTQDTPAWKFWVFVLIFSLSTPSGVFLGMLFQRVGGDSVAGGICVALASGTFLQISSMELLPRALSGDHKLTGSFGLAAGFAAMSFLALWT